MCFFVMYQFFCGHQDWGEDTKVCSSRQEAGEPCGEKKMILGAPVSGRCQYCLRVKREGYGLKHRADKKRAQRIRFDIYGILPSTYYWWNHGPYRPVPKVPREPRVLSSESLNFIHTIRQVDRELQKRKSERTILLPALRVPKRFPRNPYRAQVSPNYEKDFFWESGLHSFPCLLDCGPQGPNLISRSRFVENSRRPFDFNNLDDEKSYKEANTAELRVLESLVHTETSKSPTDWSNPLFEPRNEASDSVANPEFAKETITAEATTAETGTEMAGIVTETAVREIHKTETETMKLASGDTKFRYPLLNFRKDEIRLFKLNSRRFGLNSGLEKISGSFWHVNLHECPSYTALSYTWGCPSPLRNIWIDGFGDVPIQNNLWEFLERQSLVISKPKFFWIDFICINQSSVHEKSHQIGLMKKIYSKAEDVYIWLGTDADNSALAMDYIKNKGARDVIHTGPHDYLRFWAQRTAKALLDLFTRSYWSRMWIIQEIIHARKIIVWCGKKHCEWSSIEKIYYNISKLHEEGLQKAYSKSIMNSFAAKMVWQRAHWRHPDTPTPSLRSLIEIFCDWQCTDRRDKVIALIGMADPNTAITPDVSMSASQIYFAVREDSDIRFNRILSISLGLPFGSVPLARW